nr:MAG TPA: hypothetical protein [Caudoviricetes sp.]
MSCAWVLGRLILDSIYNKSLRDPILYLMPIIFRALCLNISYIRVKAY